jgi:hypothetical protein
VVLLIFHIAWIMEVIPVLMIILDLKAELKEHGEEVASA